MEGRRYSAEEVLALGLVHRVVPASDLLAAAREHAERLLARPYRPLVEAKARINQIARVGTPEVNAMTEGFLERG
jgi:enoyl-CoA hydratase/carnithine racemase